MMYTILITARIGIVAFLIQIDSANEEAVTGSTGRMFKRAAAIPMVLSIPTSMRMASGS